MLLCPKSGMPHCWFRGWIMALKQRPLSCSYIHWQEKEAMTNDVIPYTVDCIDML